MEDSQRAAELANENGIDVGLHINLTQKPTQENKSSQFCEYHERINAFLLNNKYNFLFYNPILRKQFKYVFQVQYEEFVRIYEKAPSHIDGHHHMHLCTNMLLQNIIPKGLKVRRNFSFKRGEKGVLNRTYRACIDKILAKRFIMTDYLFSLSQCLKNDRLSRVFELSKISNVELQTHPEFAEEFEFLMGNIYNQTISGLPKGSFAQLRQI